MHVLDLCLIGKCMSISVSISLSIVGPNLEEFASKICFDTCYLYLIKLYSVYIEVVCLVVVGTASKLVLPSFPLSSLESAIFRLYPGIN